jgi:hypothetical protein
LDAAPANKAPQDANTFVPVRVAASTAVPVASHLEVAFPNGVRLMIGTDDRELVRMSIELAAAVDTTCRGETGRGVA